MYIDPKIFNQKTPIDRFIFALENGYYAEGHELLEDDWREYKKQGKREYALALKALINASTALALYHKKNRVEAYKKVWPVFNKYIGYLDIIELENKDKFYYAKELLIKLNDKISLD